MGEASLPYIMVAFVAHRLPTPLLKEHLRTLDALHLAAVEAAGVSIVTADRRLAAEAEINAH